MAVQLPDQVRVGWWPHSGRGAATAHVLAAVAVPLKVFLLMSVIRVLIDPGWANLEGKAPFARAVLYPLCAMAVPAWWAISRRASAFPWLADLLVTLTCVSDIVGNRLGLYDSVAWFDDWMHVMNTALVSSAFVLLTVPGSATRTEIVEAALAMGMTASLGWELFEYGTFLTRSTEWTSAYSDTVGDLSLGWLGCLLAAVTIATAWRHGGPTSSGWWT